ncbi:B3 domain-containing transcription repressor VAL2 [Hibiscus syriacus]|uniref:B3 domain-containing transcription repressor VAL2 n=1 Tax=Hibiscus syriacus TaxID=106335 RepID=A0A6A3D018_HIBSY|nr:B3 domain-containing transcription repressor VAL2 [Hibiscus syriacus]
MYSAARPRRLSGEKAGLCGLEILLISAISAGLHMNNRYSVMCSTQRILGGGSALHVARWGDPKLLVCCLVPVDTMVLNALISMLLVLAASPLWMYCFKELFELLDSGGINCVSCATKSGFNRMIEDEKPNEFGIVKGEAGQLHSTSADNQLSGASTEILQFMQLSNNAESRGLRRLLQLHNDDSSRSFGQMKQEKNLPPARESGSTSLSNIDQGSDGSVQAVKPTTFVDERGKMSSVLQQASKSGHLLPKPPTSVLATGLELNAGMVPQIRVARPPAEGRGRNQLLPRYWPRITNQELQQISGDSNSTVVPLFEKVLSASDAGRIGRLVLPKACAEAFFPPISQPEGLSLRIQDVKGKEWVFQFRFWPNNNSRMYVLEGVTPCIQSMQLQAGDTVTFSRKDPEGKLVMGFRKATNTAAAQETIPSAIPNGTLSNESSFSGVFKNLPMIRGYSGLLQSLKGSTDTRLNGLWNIGSKSKRLLTDGQDALELKLTWEEAQDLLHPPPGIKPSIVTIEDHDFEEYDEPPVFGKRSIFAVRSTGGQEQWTQCDSCYKWRRLPVDALLPPKWKCADNKWDQSRSSCSAPDELTPRELENLLRLDRDFKKRRMVAFHRQTQENQSSPGLNTLANAAILGDNVADSGTMTVATTTKHPRHRPGCSCIVCIQPPSGKGKHKPTCTCTVCMTVKRRFKTLMMRKKKRQSEREAEIALRNQQACDPEKKLKSTGALNMYHHYAILLRKKQDLNCDPGHDDNWQLGSTRMSMTNLLRVAGLRLEAYLKENGLTSLVSDQQAISTSHAPPQIVNAGEPQGDTCSPSATKEHDTGDEENGENENDP